MHSFDNKRGSCGHTALMVRMERFTIAVCISSSGAMLVRFVVSDYTDNRKSVDIANKGQRVVEVDVKMDEHP